MAGKPVAKQIGALWKHTPKKGGEPFLKGVLDLGALGKTEIVIFKNTRKEKENQPDYRIVLSVPFSAQNKNNKREGEDER